ncbi:hypothetical protein GQS65_07885 [Halomarina oriensis]|uniref:Uncharacterized protein n=2 Tax=Halomarina oriensis TaxID=671145 RepID=A0A6B0GLQ5_9EURY|nr:hypothetical protein [Halomarina oriensis]
MRRLLAVLMTALLVTSAAGAAMVIGAPAMQDDDDLSFDEVDDGILLTGIASDSEDGLSQMRVRSTLDEDVTLSYRVAGSDETGTVTAKAGQDTFFNVETSGPTTVVLMYDGQNVETKNANTQSEKDLGELNVGTVDDGILLTGICSDSEDGLSQMRVRSSLDQNVTLDYRVAGSDETGTVEAVAGEDVFFNVETNEDGPTTVVLMYDGQNVETKNANTVSECDLGEENPPTLDEVNDGILLTGICSDSEDGLSQMRVRSSLDQNVTLDYRVAGSDETGTVEAVAGEDVFFNVNTSGPTTVVLMYEGENVETKNANTVSECDLGEPNVDTEDITLTAICTDTEDDLAKYRVTNENDVAVDVSYDIYGTDVNGTLSVDANSTAFFTVPTADDGSATVRLFYEDEQIDVKASNTQSDCDLGMENPAGVSIEYTCSVDGADATVTNDNDVPVTIEVTGDASLNRTIEAGGTVSFENVANGEYNVTTLVDGTVVGEETVVIDCEADDGDDGMDDGDDSDDSDDGMDDGDDGQDDGQDGDVGDGEDMPAYQIDVAAGDVIETLGVDGDDEDDAPDFYGTQGRLLQAQTVLADGTVTGSHMVPGENVTKSLAGCHVSYTPVSYDGESGEVTLTVSVSDDADCEGVTLTLAGYELPGDDTTFVRANADGQELVAYETVTLDAGDSGTVVIDLDGESEA